MTFKATQGIATANRYRFVAARERTRKQRPKWVILAEYKDKLAARRSAWRIRTGQIDAFGTDFEAKHVKNLVYIRKFTPEEHDDC